MGGGAINAINGPNAIGFLLLTEINAFNGPAKFMYFNWLVMEGFNDQVC